MQPLTSRWLTLAAFIAVVALGLTLTVTSLSAARTEAALRRQIAELVRQNRQSGAVWGARLAICETGGGASRGRVTHAAISDAEQARQLARTSPAGFDVCARMESADQAVLKTLKK